MKIGSWNVNSLKARLAHVLQWLEDQQPDVLGLQETKTIDENFPRREIEALGYHVQHAGQKAYNGVALLSREPATEVFVDIPTLKDKDRRIIGATFNGVRIINLYVVNGQTVGSEKYAYKLAGLVISMTSWLSNANATTRSFLWEILILLRMTAMCMILRLGGGKCYAATRSEAHYSAC